MVLLKAIINGEYEVMCIETHLQNESTFISLVYLLLVDLSNESFAVNSPQILIYAGHILGRDIRKTKSST